MIDELDFTKILRIQNHVDKMISRGFIDSSLRESWIKRIINKELEKENNNESNQQKESG